VVPLQVSSASGEAPKNPTASPNSKKGATQEELRPAVVEEVLDWLKDEVDGSWLDDCVEDVAEPQVETLELQDAGKKCTSIIGANGDYRSGMAREAVAYLLKSSMSANKARAKKTFPRSNSNHSADNSTVAPSTAASQAASHAASQAASACPTHRSEKQEEPVQSFRTALPSEPDQEWRTVTPPSYSRTQSPRQLDAPAEYSFSHVNVPAQEKQNNSAADHENSATVETVQGTWGFAALPSALPSWEHLQKGIESLSLPTVPSWPIAAKDCSNLKIAHREVVEHAPALPASLQQPVDEPSHGDEWANDHFAALENVAQSLKAASAADAVDGGSPAYADDECRSYVTSVICPPVVPPLTFPTSYNQDQRKSAVTETLPTVSSQSHSNCSTARSEVETKGADDKATCVGISSSEDVCPKGHDLRWHAWQCSICEKRGCGLRFSCVECPEANLCVSCKKTQGAQKDIPPMHAKMSHETQPANGTNAITENAVAPPKNDTRSQVAPGPTMEVAAPKNAPGAARSSSSRRERPAGSATKSVLSVNTMGTSSAAQLLGGLAQQQGTKPRSSSKSAIGAAGASKSVVGAAGSTQRRSGTGRAGASVLSVKNTSSSAAASLLGPMLDQTAKR